MNEPLLITILLILVFAIQHSFAISDLFKEWVIRLLGERFYQRYYRLIFTGANSLILALLLPYLLQLPDTQLMTYPGPARIASRILQCLGIWVFIQAGRKIDFLHLFGVRQVISRGKDALERNEEILVRDGIYGRVRHPIYFGSLLILWGEPHLMSTQNGIALVILSTLYFYFGSLLEERRMVRQFGEEYRRYQEEVPRLVPFLKSS